MASLGPAVSFFGGSRVEANSLAYKAARESARLLSKDGVSVITGGGPGIMEAANHGAKLGGRGKSVGLVITLPFEERPNPYLDVEIIFEHLASRKVAFCRYSRACVFFQGGVGTLDELFEVLTLLATGKMPAVPILMYDTMFWSGLLDWIRAQILARGLLHPEILDNLIFVDHPQDVRDRLSL